MKNDANYEKATVRKQLFFRVITISQEVILLKGACIILLLTCREPEIAFERELRRELKVKL